jgi:acetyl esterase
MRLDPKFRAFLDAPGAELLPPPDGVTAAMMREAMKANPMPVAVPPIHATRDITVKGAQSDIRARLYRPSAMPNLPLIVYFHGGGFVLCDLDTHDAMCRELANASGCAVASVEYRLAPETRFPGALEDCHAALRQLTAQGRGLGVDPSRIAVAGDSAGGNLATAAAMLARDRGGPVLRYQALIYPALDPGCESESMKALARGYFLTQDVMKWFWSCYLTSPADAVNPLAAPLRATSLAGLPPATILTAEFDPPRDEGEAYADRLRAAGVPVVARRYLGMIHGFASLPFITEVANRAIADVGHDLRVALTA